MSPPTINDILGGYEFIWPDLNIKATRIRMHASDGRITGELLISSSLVEGKAIYPPSSFNFTADRSRSSLAKTLNEDFPKWDWKDILNLVCKATADRIREGEPIRELWTSEDIPKPEYLLEPLLIKGLPTIIFGEKGVTKSTLALVIYICLTLPWHDNPLGWKVPTRSTKTAILDYELPGIIAQYNAKRIQEGMGLGPIPLYHRRCRIPLSDDIEQILGWVSKLGIEVVIIDSLARACGGDLIKTEPANDFFEAIDKLNVTSLILAQTSKDIETKRKTVYGNALFTYYARNIFELCRSDFSQEDELDVGLFHRWSNLSKTYPDMGFRITFNEKGTHIESQPVSVAEFKTKVDSQKAIMDALKSGAMSVKELADITGVSESNTRVILSRLKKRGITQNIVEGKWGLCFQGRNIS
jgi:hypothetical protein